MFSFKAVLVTVEQLIKITNIDTEIVNYFLIGAAIWIMDRWIDSRLSRIVSTNVDLKAGIRRKREKPGGPEVPLKELKNSTLKRVISFLCIFVHTMTFVFPTTTVKESLHFNLILNVFFSVFSNKNL